MDRFGGGEIEWFEQVAWHYSNRILHLHQSLGAWLL